MLRKEEMAVESGVSAVSSALLDDDGRPKRTGTVWTASAHIITAVVGAGVLSLAWAVAQLGWIIGITCILIFACVTLYTNNLLADCYRYLDPVIGNRNYTYMEAVKTHLGGKMHIYFGVIQYSILAGLGIGYTITTSKSVVSMLKNKCFEENGIEAPCHFSNNSYMLGFGIIQIFLSQIPNFHKLSWLSISATIMSFGYTFIGIGLSLAKVAQGNGRSTSLFPDNNGKSSTDRMWNVLVALGNIALASGYTLIAIDIQDSLKSSPPENKVMKRANRIGVTTMTILFLLSACSGYAAFGSDTPGSILMSNGSQKPFWLVDLANVFIIVHMVGAYQVVVQPFYRIVEISALQRWPNSSYITGEYIVSICKMKFNINIFRLTWRSIYVVVAIVLAMAMPFFNDMLGLLGAIGFWPSVVYFPVEMFIVKQNIKKGTIRWIRLQSLSFVCFLVSVVTAVGAIHGLGQALVKYKPFMYKE